MVLMSPREPLLVKSGCGCKIAPASLSELFVAAPIRGLPKAVLVGTETAHDAAVYKPCDSRALVGMPLNKLVLYVIGTPLGVGILSAAR